VARLPVAETDAERNGNVVHRAYQKGRALVCGSGREEHEAHDLKVTRLLRDVPQPRPRLWPTWVAERLENAYLEKTLAYSTFSFIAKP
jgi:hypothetical protein